MKMTKAEKLIDNRINKAYKVAGAGLVINIMSIGDIFKVGRKSIADGDDDATLTQKLRDFTVKIAV